MKLVTYLELSMRLVVLITKPICVKAMRILNSNIFNIRGNEVADCPCQGMIDAIIETMQNNWYSLTDLTEDSCT
eukprot:15351898-Ditylum_brightwellii.AAC.1